MQATQTGGQMRADHNVEDVRMTGLPESAGDAYNQGAGCTVVHVSS